ncbi:MAG TPA: ABC transporter permease [Anaerolineaceae bacterium]|jgi:putative ABC transport system permease protein|nr:ABC transporter permease [Anaerolineaceae bacterium]
MSFIELAKFIFENIKRQKGRVILTSLGVMIGSASIVLLVALVGGLQQSATAQFTSNASLSEITVSAGFSGGFSMMGGGGSPGGGGGMGGGGSTVRTSSESEELLLTDDVVETISFLEHVASVSAEQSVSGNSTLIYQKYEGRVSLTGVDVDDLSELGLSVDEGETELNSGTIILGYSVSENMYRPNYSGSDATLTTNLLGKQVKVEITKMSSSGRSVKTMRFRVVGILAESGDQSDYAAYITMTDADTIVSWVNGQRVNHSTDGYSSLTVRVDDSDNVLAVADEITAMGYQTQTAQSFLENVNSLFSSLQLVFGGVGGITLLVAALGIANTMTMAILERTKEIGLLKALGATNKDILGLFIGEAAGIGLIGGMGGLVISMLLGSVINAVGGSYLTEQATASGTTVTTSILYMPFYLPLFALAFSTIMGSLSGLFPAMKAQSLPPVIALKYE